MLQLRSRWREGCIVIGGPEFAEARDRLSRIVGSYCDDEGRMRLDPDKLEQDLARLVLAVMELLRELMELQAIRRLEAGNLTPEQESALSEALYRSREKLREIARQFGLSEEDLSLGLNLGATAV